MTDAAKRRGRPATTARRQQLARETLLAAVMEELLVANGRSPRGNTSLTRSMKDLHRKVASDHDASLRWVEAAWQQCREAVVSKVATEIADRLNEDGHSDARLEHEQQQRRERWAAERSAADAAWIKRRS